MLVYVIYIPSVPVNPYQSESAIKPMCGIRDKMYIGRYHDER